MPVPVGVDRSYVKYFTLKWTALASTVDTTDADEDPDLDNLSGTVLLKPTLTQPLLFKNIPTPFTLPIMRRQVDLAEGQVDEQGRKYIKLEAAVPDSEPTDWYWMASFEVAYRGIPVSINPVTFMGAPNSEVDLTNMLIASMNTSYPDINQPSLNTFVMNFGGFRGGMKLTSAEFESIVRNPETVYFVYDE